MFEIGVLAEMCHELIRVAQKANGEEVVYPHWDEAEQWMRDSSADMVQAMIGGKTPEQIHAEWLRQRTEAGWTYGPVKDMDQRTNPSMVPYLDLPVRQWIKDKLVRSVILAVAS